MSATRPWLRGRRYPWVKRRMVTKYGTEYRRAWLGWLRAPLVDPEAATRKPTDDHA